MEGTLRGVVGVVIALFVFSLGFVFALFLIFLGWFVFKRGNKSAQTFNDHMQYKRLREVPEPQSDFDYERAQRYNRLR